MIYYQPIRGIKDGVSRLQLIVMDSLTPKMEVGHRRGPHQVHLIRSRVKLLNVDARLTR